jgi:hypothetical protein
MRERDAIYADPEADEASSCARRSCEAKYAEYGGYTRRRARASCSSAWACRRAAQRADERGGAGLEAARAARAGALRRPGHPAARRADQQPRHQQHPLARGRAQRALEHHGDHLARPALPLERLHAHGGRGLRRDPVYAGNYDDYMEASTLAKQQLQKDNAKAKDRIADLEEFVRRFRAHKAKARQATSRMKQIEKLKVGGREALQPAVPVHPVPGRREGEAAPPRGRGEGAVLRQARPVDRGGREGGDRRPERRRQSTLLQNLLKAKWAEKARVGYWPQDASTELGFDETLAEWLSRWRRDGQDDQIVRATLGSCCSRATTRRSRSR